MEKRTVIRKDVTVTDSPYSPAVFYGSLVFVSGQVSVDPKTGTMVSDDFREQTEQVFQNLEAVLYSGN